MKRAPLRSRHLPLAALAAVAVFAAPAAHAFTYETKNYSDDSYLRYSDPDKKVEQFNNGEAPAKPGGTTFHFEVRPSNDGFINRGNGRFAPSWGSQPFPDGR